MPIALVASIAFNLLLGAALASEIGLARADLRWIFALLPWALVFLSFFLLGAMARYVQRKATTAQFVVLRGRVSCPECAYLLDLDDKHCARCGYAVAQINERISCAECRARNWEDDTWCRQCGKSLAPPQAEA
ncbi:MAG: zinc ribbon domain-containing protein [Armatimonadetes bacterium]|nr:zinc ribbon domain-containing protein [Armatimonadota bacterium]